MKLIRKEKRMKELSFDEYVEIFLSNIPRAERVDRNCYRGRCVACGDSKRFKNKKRLYLMRERGNKPSVIVCHNCGIKTTAKLYYKNYVPGEVERREKNLTEKDLEMLKELSEGKRKNIVDSMDQTLSGEKLNIAFEEELKRAKATVGKFFESFTYSIKENPEAHTYMSNRNIPENYISEMKLLIPEFHKRDKFKYFYFKDYVFVPFIDSRDGEPYYFHSRRFRNFSSEMATYLSCPYRTEEIDVDFFLNELRVNKEKPIVIAEGTLDSLNLPNSVGVNGVNKLTEEKINWFEYRYNGSKIIYALDNEINDKAARKKVKELLRMNKNVFLWSLMSEQNPKVKDIKDFNGLCCIANRNRIPLETIERYTTNNISSIL